MSFESGNKDRNVEAYNLRKEGKSLKEISEIIGISKQAVSELVKREEHRQNPELYFKSTNSFRTKSKNYECVVYPNVSNWMKIHNISFEGLYYFGGLETQTEKTRIRSLLTGKYKFWRGKEIDFMKKVTGMREEDILFRLDVEEN